jgi:hypothetical protein
METSKSLTITEDGRLSISSQYRAVALYQSDIAVDAAYTSVHNARAGSRQRGRAGGVRGEGVEVRGKVGRVCT